MYGQGAHKKCVLLKTFVFLYGIPFRGREIVILKNIEYTSGTLICLTADFGAKNIRKVDADFFAAREEENW